MPDVAQPANAAFVVALDAGRFEQSPSWRMREGFDVGLLQEITANRLAAQFDDSPILTSAPNAINTAFTADDGSLWFVPGAIIAKRSKTSPTSAVFLEHTGTAWNLRVMFDLTRDASLPAGAKALPLTDFNGMLVTNIPGVSCAFTSFSDEVSPDSTVVRRITASTPVDQNQIASVLREDQTAQFTLQATVHYRQPGPTPSPPVVVHPGKVFQIEPGQFEFQHINAGAELQAVQFHEAVPVLADEHPAAFHMRLQDAVFTRAGFRDFPRAVLPTPPPPSSQTSTLSLLPANGLSAWFPTQTHANRPIYALVDSAFGYDPDSSWNLTDAGTWKAAPLRNQFYILPAEYRLRYDIERGLPDVSILLTPGATQADFKIRARFALVPCFDAVAQAELRKTIADAEQLVYPEFVIGGYDGVNFLPSTLLSGLGGNILSAASGATAVDPAGFELVFDCTQEFYTLLTTLLAPNMSGPSTGVVGIVRFTLKRSADDATPVPRDVHVNLRLDQPAPNLVEFDLLPPAPRQSWPWAWAPPPYAKITTRTGRPVQIGKILPTLLVADPLTGIVKDAVVAVPDPLAVVVGGPDSSGPTAAPTPPPAPPLFPGNADPNPLVADDGVRRPELEQAQHRLADLGHAISVTGVWDQPTIDATLAFQKESGIVPGGVIDEATWNALFPASMPPVPVAGPGEAIVALAPSEPIDPRVVSGLAMEYAGVVMPVNAALVLQRVHELAASGTLTTSIRVESFQLKHPENLGPDLADVFGVEVQVRRGAQTPISAFLTRDEPDKSVPLAFTIADLVSGATPDAPQFDWRRRNMTPKGNGPFSAWERVVGKELFVTPVAADTPLGQP